MSDNAWNNASTEEAKEFNKPLEAGSYSFQIDGVETKSSNASGMRYYNFTLKEIDSGTCVFYPIYASEDYMSHNNQEWVAGQIQALKRLFMVSKAKMPANLPTSSDIQALDKCFVDAKIITEENTYQGNTRIQNKLVDCYPFSGQIPQEAVIGDKANTLTTSEADMDGEIPF